MRRLNWDRRVKRSSSRCLFRASAYWSRSRKSANRFSSPSSYSLCPETCFTVSKSTPQSQQQHTPKSATAHSTVSNSPLHSQQQHTPKSATAYSTVSNSTLQSQQQHTLQSATAHSTVSNSTLYCQQQHTPKSATAHSTVSNSTELYS